MVFRKYAIKLVVVCLTFLRGSRNKWVFLTIRVLSQCGFFNSYRFWKLYVEHSCWYWILSRQPVNFSNDKSQHLKLMYKIVSLSENGLKNKPDLIFLWLRWCVADALFSLWTQDVYWTFIRHSENFQDVLQRLIYVQFMTCVYSKGFNDTQAYCDLHVSYRTLLSRTKTNLWCDHAYHLRILQP